jgi:hypothetical protein
MNTHHLHRTRRVDGRDLFRGSFPVAADDQVVLAAKLLGHMVERSPHGARVARFGEIDERLIGKLAFRRALLDTGDSGVAHTDQV